MKHGSNPFNNCCFGFWRHFSLLFAVSLYFIKVKIKMDPNLKKLEQQLNALAAKFKEELSSIRANRPTAKLVEDIKVDYFGQMMLVKQLGSIAINPPREIIVNCWDKKAVAAIAKAIEGAHLGLSVVIDGGLVRINLPPLTNERRKELIKLVHGLAEKQRIAIRIMRDEFNKIAKANTDEDMREYLKKQIQDLVDKTNKNIEEVLKAKEKEISE